jgi:hypothetical protein
MQSSSYAPHGDYYHPHHQQQQYYHQYQRPRVVNPRDSLVSHLMGIDDEYSQCLMRSISEVSAESTGPVARMPPSGGPQPYAWTQRIVS